MDSMFFMKRPYDFIAMAQQERRASMVEALRKDLLSHKVSPCPERRCWEPPHCS